MNDRDEKEELRKYFYSRDLGSSNELDFLRQSLIVIYQRSINKDFDLESVIKKEYKKWERNYKA